MCNQQEYTTKVDIWALGVLLFELIELQVPFLGRDEFQIIKQIKNCEAPPTADRAGDELKELVSSLMTYEPEKRPTITEVLKTPIISQALTNLLQN